MEFLKHFKATIIFAIICLTLSFFWGYTHGPQAGLSNGLSLLGITAILAVMELSLSFDNAVVNASILKNWNEYWQKIFLTVGIIIAVFGMRLVFPIAIVSVTTDLNLMGVVNLALNDPATYSEMLLSKHTIISAFGGIFLWLVFANFLFDNEKEHHWLGKLEKSIGSLGEVSGITYISALLVLIILLVFIPATEQLSVMYAGLTGILIFAGVDILGWFLEKLTEDETEAEANSAVAKGVVKAGIGGFLYLELLDASFSFDGVVGAFAITTDVVVIMLGLAIGAMAVRCITIYLVKQGTLDAYRYLEHGAMYAIGVLALILLSSSFFHLPEIVTGLIGVLFIVSAIICSIAESKKETA